MLKQVTDYLQKCPFFIDTVIGRDYLGENIGAVSVHGGTRDPVVQRYADGATLRQFVFEVLIRSDERLDLEHFFDAVTEWFSQGVPLLGDGQCAQRFEIVKSGAVQDRDYSSIRYGMTWRLLYYQRGE